MAAATFNDISRWFDDGVGAYTHMLVVCDTYDWSDYPVYVGPEQNVHDVIAKNSGPNMTKLMEVYNYELPKASQMAERRAYHP
jgi:hypothetical protein